MSNEESIPFSLPLDSDGFLRRECPTCEREFKWLPTESDRSDASADVEGVRYSCPYCGIQAPAGSWFTKAQIEAVKAKATRELIEPKLQEFTRGLARMNRPGSLIRFEARVERDKSPLPALTEKDDMRRVDFECHPSEPVKVLDDWVAVVRCLVCGTPARES